MSETLDVLRTAYAAGNPLLFAGFALLAALCVYVLVRRMMRAIWARYAMRIGYFIAVVGLVGGAIFSLSYYRIDAWLPVSGSILLELLRSPLSWSAAAAVVAAGLALRKPVPPRHGVRISRREKRREAEKVMAAETSTDSESGEETNVVRGPWRKAA